MVIRSRDPKIRSERIVNGSQSTCLARVAKERAFFCRNIHRNRFEAEFPPRANVASRKSKHDVMIAYCAPLLVDCLNKFEYLVFLQGLNQKSMNPKP